MTITEREQLEKDILYDSKKAQRDYTAHRVKLARMGEKLAELGNALIHDPESINPLPEMDAPVDYREALNNLPSRQQVIDLCREAKTLRERHKTTAERRALLGFGDH